MRDVSPQRVAAEKPAPLQGSYPWHLRSGKGCRQALALLAILGSVTSLLSRCSLAGEAERWGSWEVGAMPR